MGWGDCERTERHLALRALRAGWDVPAERRPGLIAVAMGLAEDPAVPPRERLAAVRALILASRTELAAIETAMRAEDHESTLRRLAALESALEVRARGEPGESLAEPAGGAGA